ncbi:MAG: DUF6267 family protein, partial [Acholeplasmataceae bacterium]
MFTKVLKHELRNITRDRMYAFFVFYEILLIALSLWLIPYLQDTSGDLAEKLVVAFNELKDLGIKDVIQGDIMFTKGDLNKESIDGESYITFQPNTIVYAVPAKSDLAKQITKANL